MNKKVKKFVLAALPFVVAGSCMLSEVLPKALGLM